MKYAFMTFSTPELTLDEVLALAKKLGYDGIEPRLDAKHRHGIEVDATPAQRAEARKKAEDAGVPLCCVATSRSYADPSKTRDSVDLTRRSIDLAGDVGAPRIRVFGGGFPATLSRPDAIWRVAEALHAVADHARDRGVRLCVETHDSWCDPNDLVEVMRRVNHPAVAINWDIMHPVRRGGVTMAEAFQIVKPWVQHCHIHDGTEAGSLCWIGTGVVDHKTAIQCLKTIGFDGYLSGEWINRTPGYEEHLPREIATLKQYEKELGI